MRELAALFLRHATDYINRFKNKILHSHLRAIGDIVSCRTEVMGGHKHQCDSCGAMVYSYHSCNNRACPTCGYQETLTWIEKQQEKLLKIHYFHLIVTLPHEFNEITRSNQRKIYSLLLTTAFHAVNKVIQRKVCGNALVGAIAVLHTWTRSLLYHNHAHLLIPGAGIDKHGNLWRTKDKSFLVPEKAVSKVFRAMFVKKCRKIFPQFQIPQVVFQKDWVVTILPTLSHKKNVVEYLSRYVKRTAITNKRIIKWDEKSVTFSYKDNKTREYKTVTLPVFEFMRRFLQHVLPKGFTKVRHYGLLHHTNKKLFLLTKKKLENTGNHSEIRDETGDDTKQSKTRFIQCPH
ncbi:MAG: transposase, partial [Chitinispirillia bacterium]